MHNGYVYVTDIFDEIRLFFLLLLSMSSISLLKERKLSATMAEEKNGRITRHLIENQIKHRCVDSRLRRLVGVHKLRDNSFMFHITQQLPYFSVYQTHPQTFGTFLNEET